MASMGISLPPTGMSTVQFGVMGQNMVKAAAAYFTTPTASTTTPVMAAVNGVLRVAGTTMGVVTGVSINVDGGMSTQAVVGSNVTPDVFAGRVRVSGQLTALFDSVLMRDAFMDETEFAASIVLSGDSTAASKFIGFTMPRCKAGGAKKSDGEQGLVLTVPFTALYNGLGGTGSDSEQTTLWVQDSDAV
jgi:hypothetical protein